MLRTGSRAAMQGIPFRFFEFSVLPQANALFVVQANAAGFGRSASYSASSSSPGVPGSSPLSMSRTTASSPNLRAQRTTSMGSATFTV